MAPLAIVLLVQDRTQSFAAAGAAVGSWGIASAVSQPLWARPAGRGSASRVVALTSAFQAAVLVGLALSGWTAAPPLVILAGIAGLLAAPTTAVARTLWPALTRDQHELDSLFSLDATSQELIFIAGPALVGAAVAVHGPGAAIVSTAACGAIGGLVFAFVVRPLWQPHPRAGQRGSLGRGVVVVSAVLFLVTLGVGLVEVGVPAAAILDGRRSASGWLLAVWSVGSLLGGVVSSRIRWQGSPASRLAGLLVGLTVGTTLVIASWHLGLAWLAAALFLAGLALAPTFAASYGVIGDVSSSARRTDAFAFSGMCILLGLGAGAGAGGFLAEVSPTWTFAAGAVVTAVALAAWLGVRRSPLGAAW
jgi:MFS family permease